MTGNGDEITRRRFLSGLVTVAGASAATGAGTVAYFSDSESSSGNTVQTGTLDLTLGDEAATATFLNATNIAPGDGTDGNEYGDVTLTNDGSVDATLEIKVDEIRSYDGEGNEPGTLQDKIEVRPELDGTQACEFTTISDLDSAIDTYPTVFSGESLNTGQAVTFELYWRFPSGAKKGKGHSVEMDFAFRLTQDGVT